MTVPSPAPTASRSASPRGRRLGLVAAGLATMVLVWLVGVAALGRSAEDLCVDDLEVAPGYSTYSQSAKVWPPEFHCTLRPVDPAANPTIVIDHPWFAGVRLVVTAGLPVAAVLGAGLTVVWLRGN